VVIAVLLDRGWARVYVGMKLMDEMCHAARRRPVQGKNGACAGTMHREVLGAVCRSDLGRKAGRGRGL